MIFTQPTDPDDALAFVNKVLVGSPMSSSEWQDVPVELRTRAFFSSQVESAQVLQRARNGITDFLANNLDDVGALKTGGRAQFVDQMQKFLAANGIQRGEGGLTDITSATRLGLIFNTQVRQAEDYTYWLQGLQPSVLNAFPAMRFIRVRAVKEPRQNHARYQGQVFLKTDPIWYLVINKDFGVPWGPWGWGCGHDVEDVDRAETQSLGLLSPGEQINPGSFLKKWNFNTGLQASIQNLDPDLVEKLKRVFGDQIAIEDGFIRWTGRSATAGDNVPPIPQTITPPAAVLAARTSPVSAAVDIQTTAAAAKTVRNVLSLIDQVHDDGDLDPLILNHHISAGSQGTYYSGANMIGIRRTNVIQREMTIAHEIGHWLDDQALGNDLPSHLYASESSPELEEWRRAVMASQAIQKLKTAPGYANNPRYRAYVLRTREIWARAYAQYIATRSGDATLLQQISTIRNGTSGGYWIDSQWSEEDFKPIAAAIDKLFNQLGWL